MATALKLDKNMLTEYAAEVIIYFEKHKLLEIVARIFAEIGIVRPSDPKLWISNNIKRIANYIYKNSLDYHFDKNTEVKFFQLPRRYLHRVVIFGRRGSGRKTQALALTKCFGLVYIDVDLLIRQYLGGDDILAEEIKKAFSTDCDISKSEVIEKIVHKRIAKMDALRKGWVMVNYPNTLVQFKNVLEKFKIPPNRIIYLQCSEILAMRRLIEKPKLGSPEDSYNYINYEMLHFRKHESTINEYLQSRYETIYINATPCFEIVKTNLLAQLQHMPYILGTKY